MVNLVDASLDFWLTSGRNAAEFEKRFALACGVRSAILVKYYTPSGHGERDRLDVQAGGTTQGATPSDECGSVKDRYQ